MIGRGLTPVVPVTAARAIGVRKPAAEDALQRTDRRRRPVLSHLTDFSNSPCFGVRAGVMLVL
jgi:hypothetical protein